MNGMKPANGTRLRLGKLPVVWLPDPPAPASQWPRQEAPATPGTPAKTGRIRKLTAGIASAATGKTAFLAATVAVIAAGLGVYAAAASYDTVSHLAAVHHVALPRLNPLGIDGGLAGVIILDVVATWLAEPIWWLRLAARLFAAATIAANAAAGWPDPVGTGLRVAAPVLFVIITEAGRTMLLRGKHAAERRRKAAEREERRRERIPRIRWVLDFGGTYALWKRMRLWREPSYRHAVDLELERLAAIEKLAMRYGAEAWQNRAPADLVWMLTSGVRMTEALARVPVLIAQEDALEAEKAARAEASRSIPASMPETTPGHAPDAPAVVPEARPRASAKRAPKPALKLTAARSRSMSPDKLAEHVEAMLDANAGTVSVNKIKTDLSVGTDKANKALEIARRNRARVVPIGERRQA